MEFAVLPCASCRTGDRCPTPSWSGILTTCPSHHMIRAFTTIRMLGSSYSSASSCFILLLQTPSSNTPSKLVRGMCCSNTPRAFASSARKVQDSCDIAISDISHISCGLEVFWISIRSAKPILCTIPLHNASPDVVVRSNNRPKIAKLLYYLEIVAVNWYASQMCLSLRQTDISSSLLWYSIQFLLFRALVWCTPPSLLSCRWCRCHLRN